MLKDSPIPISLRGSKVNLDSYFYYVKGKVLQREMTSTFTTLSAGNFQDVPSISKLYPRINICPTLSTCYPKGQVPFPR